MRVVVVIVDQKIQFSVLFDLWIINAAATCLVFKMENY